jgi:hypothetical protein
MHFLRRKHVCRVCGKVFESKERLENHKKTHRRER